MYVFFIVGYWFWWLFLNGMVVIKEDFENFSFSKCLCEDYKTSLIVTIKIYTWCFGIYLTCHPRVIIHLVIYLIKNCVRITPQGHGLVEWKIESFSQTLTIHMHVLRMFLRWCRFNCFSFDYSCSNFRNKCQSSSFYFAYRKIIDHHKVFGCLLLCSCLAKG